MKRRDVLGLAAGAAASAVLGQSLLGGPSSLESARAADEEPPTGELIIDTHQHLWDLSLLKLPWLADAPEVLKKTYHLNEYRQATQGLNVKAVYMEVDVALGQHDAEARHVVELSKKGVEAAKEEGKKGDGKWTTIAAVIGGRPASADFGEYLARHAEGGHVKGVRQVLHNPDSPAGACLSEEFVRGVRLLGERGLSFDLCMRPGELGDGARLAELCPDTRFVVDHCGNPDLAAFRKTGNRETDAKAAHTADSWKRDIQRLADRPNTICKISGIVAGVQEGWSADDLAPVVNHCLDSFGPDRVVFGGDWPVCLLGAPLRDWVDALTQIISHRSPADRRKLWSENAIRFYGLGGIV